MKCPNCGLENPPEASKCDCGYDFVTGTIKEPLLPQENILPPNKESILAQAGSNLKLFDSRGWFLLLCLIGSIIVMFSDFWISKYSGAIGGIIMIYWLVIFYKDVADVNRFFGEKPFGVSGWVLVFAGWCLFPVVYPWWLFKRTRYYLGSMKIAIIGSVLIVMWLLSIIVIPIVYSNSSKKKATQVGLAALSIIKTTPGENQQSQKFDKETYGEWTLFLDTFSEMKKNSEETMAGWNKEIEYLPKVLTLKTFSNQKNILEAQDKIVKTINALDKYEESVSQVLVAFGEKLSNSLPSSVPDEGKKTILIRCETSRRNVSVFWKGYFEIERRIFLQIYDLLEFLKSKNGKYETTNENIFFANDFDVKKYKEYMSTITKLAEEESKCIEEFNRIKSEKMENLKNSIKDAQK